MTPESFLSNFRGSYHTRRFFIIVESLNILDKLVEAVPNVVVLVLRQIVVEGLDNNLNARFYRITDAIIGYRSPISLNSNIFWGA